MLLVVKPDRSVLEKFCEAVAAERAGWTERTAGQQPADALKKFSAGGGSRAFKPRGQTMQSADRRRCNRRKIPANVARDGELEKRGVRRGESRNGCLPPAGKFVRGEKRCIAYRVHQRFCMPIDTLHTRGIALLKDSY